MGRELTAEYLRELLRYDPETSEFRWRVQTSNVRVGDIAGSFDHKGYRRIKIDGREYRASKLASLWVTGEWPEEDTGRGFLTAERLRKLLSYNPETGEFRWRKARGHSRAGAVAGCIDNGGYSRIRIGYRAYQAHALAWLYMTGAWANPECDHINMNRTDNRLCNLREATRSQNIANTAPRPTKTSPLKGIVWFPPSFKWQARIGVNSKKIHLGYFDCSAAAHFAYVIAADKHFGEYGRTR